MKIITWNCNMAFRKKAALLLVHEPDIVIVPECEHPAKLLFKEGVKQPTTLLWFGSNKNKGLGIFSYSNYRLKLKRNHNPDIKMVIPVGVTAGSISFTLYAVWANNPSDGDGPYIEQVWKALKYYHKKINKKQTMLMGDFNSNTIWDRKYREANHSNVVKQLQKKGINSCYHLHHGQVQGKEEHPTFYLYRHSDKPYHLDYCFASKDLTDKMVSVEIGTYDFWKAYSDHVPVIITYDL
jgi:exodeoxyribonuclease III